jgi:hypothetical protein
MLVLLRIVSILNLWFICLASTLSQNILRFTLISMRLLGIGINNMFSSCLFSHFWTKKLSCICGPVDEQNSSFNRSVIWIINLHFFSSSQILFLIFNFTSILGLYWSVSHFRIAIWIMTLLFSRLAVGFGAFLWGCCMIFFVVWECLFVNLYLRRQTRYHIFV